MKFTAIIAVFTIVGCASSEPYMLAEPDDNASTAPGAAYSGEGMLYRKPMTDHRNDKQYQFFYKNCWVDNENGAPWISKRVYACNDAF